MHSKTKCNREKIESWSTTLIFLEGSRRESAMSVKRQLSDASMP